jgi:hypothetical protein
VAPAAPPATAGTAEAPAPAPAAIVTLPATVTSTVPASDPGAGPSDGHGHGTTTTTTVPRAGVKEFSSPGGSITVGYWHGALSLSRVDPAHGFYPEVKDRSPDHVDVRFRRGGNEAWRIEVRMENGRPVRTDNGGH